MTTLDETTRLVEDVLEQHKEALGAIGPMFVNRDLYGRIRLIVPEAVHDDPESKDVLSALARELAD